VSTITIRGLASIYTTKSLWH